MFRYSFTLLYIQSTFTEYFFFILGIMFLLTTSGTPISHHSAHVSAASLLDRIVIV